MVLGSKEQKNFLALLLVFESSRAYFVRLGERYLIFNLFQVQTGACNQSYGA